MKIAVVDDEAAMREQLVSYISRFGSENGVELTTTVFPSGDVFWESFARDWDIILFDIDMPGTNGIDTARKVRQADEAVTILFITNVAQYAINGYEVDAVDYVIKPIGYYDFALKFTKALRRAGRQGNRRLLLDTTKGQVAVEAREILYVEARGHYLLYKTAGAEYFVRGSISEHEKSLRPYHFERVQKSFLVNLARIENIKTAELTVGGFTIPTSKLYRDGLMMAYLRYIKG